MHIHIYMSTFVGSASSGVNQAGKISSFIVSFIGGFTACYSCSHYSDCTAQDITSRADFGDASCIILHS